jgi:hypothetical protein
MSSRTCLIAFLVATLTGIPALATTYVVHPDGTGDFPTIRDAMDAAVNGDVIELTDGTFTGEGNRDVDFLGKAVTVRSQSGQPDACVIDCENSGRCFYFHSGETPSSVLEGIGITRGFAEYGGGILCEGSSPLIGNCLFSGCQGWYAGGGICSLDYSSPYIIDCVFVENISNESIGFGGGMACAFDSNPTLVRCTFWGNQADTRGGAFSCGQHSSATLNNCTFYENTCINGSNIGLRLNAHVLLVNCIVAFGLEGSGVWGELNSTATLLCSDVYGNEGGDWVGIIGDQSGINGNISEDPLFCDPENGDFTIRGDSPCAPFSPPNAECDLIGAWPVACGPTSVESTTWGRIKAVYSH